MEEGRRDRTCQTAFDPRHHLANLVTLTLGETKVPEESLAAQGMSRKTLATCYGEAGGDKWNKSNGELGGNEVSETMAAAAGLGSGQSHLEPLATPPSLCDPVTWRVGAQGLDQPRRLELVCNSTWHQLGAAPGMLSMGCLRAQGLGEPGRLQWPGVHLGQAQEGLSRSHHPQAAAGRYEQSRGAQQASA